MSKLQTLLIFILPIFTFIYITNALYTLAFYLLYYLTCCSKPRIICKPTMRNIGIIQNCRTVEGMFFPFIFAIFGLSQTLLTRMRNVNKRKKTECIVVQTHDGGIFVIDVYEPKGCNRRSGCGDVKCNESEKANTNKKVVELEHKKNVNSLHMFCSPLCKFHFNMGNTINDEIAKQDNYDYMENKTREENNKNINENTNPINRKNIIDSENATRRTHRVNINENLKSNNNRINSINILDNFSYSSNIDKTEKSNEINALKGNSNIIDPLNNNRTNNNIENCNLIEKKSKLDNLTSNHSNADKIAKIRINDTKNRVEKSQNKFEMHFNNKNQDKFDLNSVTNLKDDEIDTNINENLESEKPFIVTESSLRSIRRFSNYDNFNRNHHIMTDVDEESNQFEHEDENSSQESPDNFVKKINDYILRDKELKVPKIYFKHTNDNCRINQINWDVSQNDITNIILVHGFNSSSDSNYILNIAHHMISEGYRVFAFNSRGTRTPLLTPLFFNIGWTCDLKDCLDYVLINYTGFVSLVGFSLGGNWSAKLLTELDPIYFKRIKCGIGISMPFDFYKLNSHMLKWPHISINRFLVKNMKKYLLRHDIFSSYFDTISSCKTIQELDQKFTSKIFGIENIDKFYKEGSCGNYIQKVRIPFMAVNSSDDPVVPISTIPIDKILESENVILLLTKRGGHLGFLGYNWDKTYPEQIVLEFVKTCDKLNN